MARHMRLHHVRQHGRATLRRTICLRRLASQGALVIGDGAQPFWQLQRLDGSGTKSHPAEEAHMQCHLIITLALAGAIGTNATAQELQPITVHEMHITDCTPPASFAVCDTWHAQIRRSFSPREIGMLFGARSA
ncbi:MAG: hypothetical protein E6K53_00015 [Gammaproteobacteria bacterium]|nr:MAG: hypothetical protein E6K53_00015 [Gammaproteobacteria bacterium]